MAKSISTHLSSLLARGCRTFQSSSILGADATANVVTGIFGNLGVTYKYVCTCTSACLHAYPSPWTGFCKSWPNRIYSKHACCATNLSFLSKYATKGIHRNCCSTAFTASYHLLGSHNNQGRTTSITPPKSQRDATQTKPDWMNSNSSWRVKGVQWELRRASSNSQARTAPRGSCK